MTCVGIQLELHDKDLKDDMKTFVEKFGAAKFRTDEEMAEEATALRNYFVEENN